MIIAASFDGVDSSVELLGITITTYLGTTATGCGKGGFLIEFELLPPIIRN